MPKIKLVFEQIKEYIEQEASSKKPGEFLNSEIQYSRLFNVSRPTVRKAIDILVNEGLVERVPGKGLRVPIPFQNNCSSKDNLKRTLLFLISHSNDDGFFARMVAACADAANEKKYSYKLINISDPEQRYVSLLNADLSEVCSAIITAYDNLYDRKLLAFLMEKNIPIVLADNPSQHFNLPCVLSDDYKGGSLCAQYLLSKGHKNILYISLSNDIYTVKQREKGFTEYFKSANALLNSYKILKVNNDIEAREKIKEMIENKDFNFSAICGYSDLPVIYAYNVLSDLGIKIPEEVSLVGYGNFRHCELLNVPLTTIDIPVYEMGYKACTMAIELYEGICKMQKIVLDVKLIERDSVKFNIN